MVGGVPVIDWHVHFPIMPALMRHRPSGRREVTEAGQERRTAALAAERAQWRAAWGFPNPETERRSVEEYADMWYDEAVAHELARVVFVTGPDNDSLATICHRHPDRFLGLAHHDPCQPGAAEEFERAIIEGGLRGYKTLAPILDWRIDDERYYPMWEVAAKHRVPVLIHFGMQGAAGGIAYNENIDPRYLETPAKDFPEVDFVVPHFGIQFVTELLFVCWACPNVHVDTSGSNQWTRWMPYPLTLADLFRKFYETIGPRRILFGTDSSWFPRGFATRYLQDQMQICRYANFPEEDIRLIFGGNAARLLGLSAEGIVPEIGGQ